MNRFSIEKNGNCSRVPHSPNKWPVREFSAHTFAHRRAPMSLSALCYGITVAAAAFHCAQECFHSRGSSIQFLPRPGLVSLGAIAASASAIGPTKIGIDRTDRHNVEHFTVNSAPSTSINSSMYMYESTTTLQCFSIVRV